MFAIAMVCLGLYLLGAFGWFLVYYTDWDLERGARYGDPDKRSYYASQLLATPLWPAALFRNLMFLIGNIKEDVDEER